MSGPRPEVVEYLAAVCPEARVTPIAGDASTRTFYRVRPREGPSRVLMDYGAAFEAETDDVRMNRIFREAGLRVAAIADVCGRAGCLLLEDLGEVSLESALAGGEADARELLERAVRLAAQVAVDGTAALRQAQSALRQARAEVLDAQRFRFEMDFFLEHYVRGLLRRERLPRGLRQGLYALADGAADTPRPVLCHRDYHSRNLMLLADGRLAMVDIQDARWGPDSYDLASLLRDPYAEIEDTWVDPFIELYRSLLDVPPPAEEFRSRFDHVAAQRLIKALGTYGHQVHVRGDRRYLSAIPRALERLRRLFPLLADSIPLYDLLLHARLLDDLPAA